MFDWRSVPDDCSPLDQVEGLLCMRNGHFLDWGERVALAILDDEPVALRLDGPRAGYYGRLLPGGGPCQSLSNVEFLREIEGFSGPDPAAPGTVTLAEGEDRLKIVMSAILRDIRPQVLARIAKEEAERAASAAEADPRVPAVAPAPHTVPPLDRRAVIDAFAPLIDLGWDRRPGPLWDKLARLLHIDCPADGAASTPEDAVGPRRDPAMAHLVLATPGLGKTHSVIEMIEQLPDAAVVWVFQPTLTKADEFARDLCAVSSRQVQVFRGRGAPVREGAKERMCARHVLAGTVAAAGHSVRKALCGDAKDGRGQCVHAGACAYLVQVDRLARHRGGGVFVMTHASLTMPPSLPAPHLVIVDEDPSFALTQETTLDVNALGVTGSWSADLPDDDDEDRRGGCAGADACCTVDEEEADEAPEAVLDMFDRLVEALASDQPLAAMSELVELEEIEAAQKVLRRIERKMLSEIGPNLKDEMVKDSLEASSLPELRKVLVAITAILRELRLFNEGSITRGTFNGVRLHGDGNGRLTAITVHGLAGPAAAPDVPLIVLDGTADPLLLGRALHRGLQVWRIDLQRQGEVVQCLGRGFSNHSLARDPRHPADRTAGDHDLLWQQIEAVLRREVGASAKKILVVSTLAVETEARKRSICADIPQAQLAWTHYGATRGINRFEDCETLVLIGRRQPPASAAEAVARAFFWDDPEPFGLGEGYEVRHRMLFDKEGGAHPTKVQVHPDRRVQRVLWQMREAEVIQALDRVRAVRHPRRIVMLNAIDLHRPDDDLDNPTLGLPADEIRSWPELLAGGNRAEVILETCAGFLPTAPRLLAKIAPEIFSGIEAAKKWLHRTDLQAALARHAAHLCEVQVRPEGQRGRTCALLLDPRRHTSLADARTALEAMTGMTMAVWIPADS